VEAELGTALTTDDYSIQTIGSSLSESIFQSLSRYSYSHLSSWPCRFLYFRSQFQVSMSSFAHSSTCYYTCYQNVFGIKITTGGIAAFLMLIDFSIDTDTLLTAKILGEKRGVTPSRPKSPQ
jgi:preprotein translocase subunit SecF